MKSIILSLKQQFFDHPEMIKFVSLLSAILSFLIQTWQINVILFLALFVLVVVDTITGVHRAKKEGVYDYRILKDKAVKKMLGYIIFLFALGVFTIVLFLVNIKDGTPLISNYYLNIPLMTSILFFCAIEFLSINDNIKSAYGIRTPSSVTDKISKFTEDQSIKTITKADETD